MPIITPSQLTFNGTEARQFSEAIIEEGFLNPSLEELHLIFEDIVAKQQIPFIGRLSKITKKDLGCGTGKTSKNIPMSEKFWEPEQLKIWLSICYKEFDQTFMLYLRNKGIDYANLTDTEIFDFLLSKVTEASPEDLLRFSWFGDKNAATIANSGVFTNGIDLTDYDQINGFWKQLFAIVAATPARRVNIAKNAGASYAAQTFDATDTTNRMATKIFQQLTLKCDARLKGKATKRIYATRSLADQYVQERLDNDKVEIAYLRMESGIDKLMIMGVEVLVIDLWDRTIQQDQDNGVKWNLPHRAVMTEKTNIPLGIDMKAAIGAFRVYFEESDETSNIKGGYKADAKVLENHLVQVAY